MERTGEPLQSLCKEIDPDNWQALRRRVQRAQEAHKAAEGAGEARPPALPEWKKKDIRASKQVLREADAEQVEEIVAALPDDAVERIARATLGKLTSAAAALVRQTSNPSSSNP